MGTGLHSRHDKKKISSSDFALPTTNNKSPTKAVSITWPKCECKHGIAMFAIRSQALLKVPYLE
ncbi:unnamed protein product [Acanthoscelides obtectus]|uniref:Uncharacterized protein n=1 Tax=Acanthoscelides obtectus TaxID=200917 RepID=A0A9P0P5S0_ACAOB|nr:unnamed protein product [Acanthoscelides obtectus]CAK1640934.1 hypothetical protein AOBTE_LOCUS12027 [Acanthoscelides obtectus]